jgi:predicted HTH transcriptional regulator
MDTYRLKGILSGLVILPKETEWVEFKHNNCDPEEIGEYISAIANSTALHGKRIGYVVWGIEDRTHKVLGTTFDPSAMKVQQQDLEHWLAIHLFPKSSFVFHQVEYEGKKVVLCEISQAVAQPVRFREYEYIRVGSHKKKLRDHADKARTLWDALSRMHFEDNVALSGVSQDDVLRLLHIRGYFGLLNQAIPITDKLVLERLSAEKFVNHVGGAVYDITNLGAILFAKDMNDFPRLSRKVLRVILYRGIDRVGENNQEKVGKLGYAVGFKGAMDYVQQLLPSGQIIAEALRQEVKVYPTIAVRELLANALIHQDFTVGGTGPMVEIFEDRIEIQNPGVPLTDLQRFIDAPPRSRNESLAAFMRRAGICEEQGLGIDRVISAVEFFQLPPPQFQIAEGHLRVTLFSPRKLGDMDQEERTRACYQHACLLYVSGKLMSNESLRKRFGIADSNYPQASRIIKDATVANLIKPYGDGISKKYAKYVPYWA